MFPKRPYTRTHSYSLSRQGGFLIPLSVILIVGISFLALAIARFSAVSASISVSEGVSLQAFYAAESGAQYAMSQIFNSAANRNAADINCNNLNGASLSFNVTGLQGCGVDISCSITVDAANTTSFYLVNSLGICGFGDLQGERVVEVSAFIQ